MTHPTGPFVVEHRRRDVVARGLLLGSVAGALIAALAVLPLVLWNGPAEALLVYPPLAAIPGAVVGAVVGALAATGVLLGRRINARRSGAAAAAGTAFPGSSRAPGR